MSEYEATIEDNKKDMLTLKAEVMAATVFEMIVMWTMLTMLVLIKCVS